MTKTDHVALTLSSATIVGITGGGVGVGDECNLSRKSLRRVSGQISNDNADDYVNHFLSLRVSKFSIYWHFIVYAY